VDGVCSTIREPPRRDPNCSWFGPVLAEKIVCNVTKVALVPVR
jgi:hypothetical protein